MLDKKSIPGIKQTKESTNIKLEKLNRHKENLEHTLEDLKPEKRKLEDLKKTIQDLNEKIRRNAGNRKVTAEKRKQLQTLRETINLQRNLVQILTQLEPQIKNRIQAIKEQLEKHDPPLSKEEGPSKTEKVEAKPFKWSYSLNPVANARIHEKASEFQQWYADHYYPFELEPQFAKVQGRSALRNANQKIFLETIGSSESEPGTISKKKGVIPCSSLLPTICNKLTCQVKQCGQMEELGVLCSFCRMNPSSTEDLSTRTCQKDYINLVKNTSPITQRENQSRTNPFGPPMNVLTHSLILLNEPFITLLGVGIRTIKKVH